MIRLTQAVVDTAIVPAGSRGWLRAVVVMHLKLAFSKDWACRGGMSPKSFCPARLWVRLHHPSARLRDLVQGATKCHGCDAFAPVIPVNEEASEAVIGRPLVGLGLVLTPRLTSVDLISR
jgi:hypothetical protein